MLWANIIFFCFFFFPTPQLVDGEIIGKSEDKIIIRLAKDRRNAFLEKNHLSDHPSVAQAMFASLQEGGRLSGLLVLRKTAKSVFLTNKAAVIKAKESDALPASTDDVRVGEAYVGYVDGTQDYGCFVRFLGDFSGLVLKSDVSNSFVVNVADFVFAGQTVVVTVFQIDPETRKLRLVLKSAETDAHRAQFASRYFAETDMSIEANAKALKGGFAQGQTVEAQVTQSKDFGFVASLGNGATGLITPEQSVGANLVADKKVPAIVLDFDPIKRIADLSVLPRLLSPAEQSAPKSGKRKSAAATAAAARVLPKSGEMVDAQIQLVKEDYAVVSLPRYGDALAYCSLKSYNQRDKPFSKFKVGILLKGSVVAVAGVAGSKRTVLAMPAEIAQSQELGKIKGSEKDVKAVAQRPILNAIDAQYSLLEDLKPGCIVKCKVKSLNANQVNVIIGSNLAGRIHVTEIGDNDAEELTDEGEEARQNAYRNIKIGAVVTCKVLGHHTAKSAKYLPLTHNKPVGSVTVDLTLRPSQVEAPSDAIQPLPYSFESVSTGDRVVGYVTGIESDCLWVHLTPFLRCKVHILEVSDDVDVLTNLAKHFDKGRRVECIVTEKNQEKGIMNLSIKAAERGFVASIDKLEAGMVFAGMILKINPITGLVVKLGMNLFGRVGLCDLGDDYVMDPFAKFSEGQLLRCYVLEAQLTKNQLDLSLRSSLVDGETEGYEVRDKSYGIPTEVKSGSIVRGFVRSIADQGVFVSLSRTVTARVRIGEISDDFVKEWKSILKPGQFVEGKIIKYVLY
jgi:rRNA biogenesis protein RRP5